MHRSIIAAACSILVATGCSRPPTGEIAAANAAVDSARAAEAPLYSAAQWDRADSLSDALARELATQAEQPALGRSYMKAKELAEQTKAAADSAREGAVAGKEQARTEAMALLDGLRSAIAELNAALAEAPSAGARGKEAQELKAEVGALERAAMAVDSAVATSRFTDARSAAHAVKTQIEGVRTRVGALRAPTRRG